MINNQTSTTATYQTFMSLAQAHPILVAKRGDSYQLTSNTNFTVLNPTQPLSFSDENDNSIVFRLQVGETFFLLTGDAGADAEEQILQTPADLKCDVLKVAHHGSRSSTTAPFLDAVNPTVAVISVGANNTYGHPHNETIQRLFERNIAVYSTEQSGTIQVDSNGVSAQVQGSPTPIPEFSLPIVLTLIFVAVTVMWILKRKETKFKKQ
jgi:competence protein ComEC